MSSFRQGVTCLRASGKNISVPPRRRPFPGSLANFLYEFTKLTIFSPLLVAYRTKHNTSHSPSLLRQKEVRVLTKTSLELVSSIGRLWGIFRSSGDEANKDLQYRLFWIFQMVGSTSTKENVIVRNYKIFRFKDF